MKRGDIVTYAFSGDYGKPRPAVVIQTNALLDTDSVLLCLLTSDPEDRPALFRRIEVAPSVANGLERTSFVMTDKILAVRRTKCREMIGQLEDEAMRELNEALLVVLGLAD